MVRGYTTIEQSKKLAEILPLESADMYWSFGNIKFMDNDYDSNVVQHIPSWSLAALYSILPNSKNESTTLSRSGWKIEPIEYLDNWWCEYEDDNDTKVFSVSADNPVDACYEMIIRLNELKML